MVSFLTLIIPLLGTTVGAAAVFFRRRDRAFGNGVLSGFAAGVMAAASVWSLLLPSLERGGSVCRIGWLPAAVGFLLGVGFLFLTDALVPDKSRFGDAGTARMLLAITVHNVPEGLAVGVALAGALRGTGLPPAGAFALALGIGLQNLPEGAIVSLPLRNVGMSRARSFLWGTLSGAVEPAAALLSLLFVSGMTFLLPYCLSFAAGAMLSVVAGELLPEVAGADDARAGRVSAALGFLLMMVMDVALS